MYKALKQFNTLILLCTRLVISQTTDSNHLNQHVNKQLHLSFQE